MATEEKLITPGKASESYMDKFIAAASTGKKLPSQPEELPSFSSASIILSASLHDQKNHWKEYFCVQKMQKAACAGLNQY